MSSNDWDEIIYPFPNFNGSTIEVWEWITQSPSTPVWGQYISRVITVVIVCNVFYVVICDRREIVHMYWQIICSLNVLVGLHGELLNASLFSAAYMHRWTVSALVQNMALRRPLCELRLTYHQLVSKEQIQWNLIWNSNILIQEMHFIM